MNTKRKLILSLSALATSLFATAAFAQAWPNQPIKIIVPFPAGGASDQIGRAIGQKMSDELKVPVVIENRAGANGSVGATALAKSAPDGYTLMVASIGVYAINAGLYSKLPYDPLKDFAPISVLV
jgi:tripartite-type tricarboxylate transporter receptor subunit TctC